MAEGHSQGQVTSDLGGALTRPAPTTALLCLCRATVPLHPSTIYIWDVCPIPPTCLGCRASPALSFLPTIFLKSKVGFTIDQRDHQWELQCPSIRRLQRNPVQEYDSMRREPRRVFPPLHQSTCFFPQPRSEGVTRGVEFLQLSS